MLKNTSDYREEGENRKMKNFVKVDTRFQKSINLTLDTGDMALVNRYIPTRSSVYKQERAAYPDRNGI